MRQESIMKLRAAQTPFAVATTGGGAAFIAEYLATPGGSATFLEGVLLAKRDDRLPRSRAGKLRVRGDRATIRNRSVRARRTTRGL